MYITWVKINMIFVAGGGFYGAKAVLALKSRGFIIVVDLRKECLAKNYVECISDNVYNVLNSGCGSALIIGDAVKTFVNIVEKGFIPDIVVPAIPKHFAGEVLRLYLELRGVNIKPYTYNLDIVVKVIEVYGVEAKVYTDLGVVVASYIPFNLRCKPGCNEPRVCPVTGKNKVAPLHKLIKFAFSKIVDKVMVLESKLIAEDVGGFCGYDLVKVLRDLENVVRSCKGIRIAIATACSCHGIANLFIAK